MMVKHRVRDMDAAGHHCHSASIADVIEKDRIQPDTTATSASFADVIEKGKFLFC